MAETYPNRFYQHAAQTDRHPQLAPTIATLPTIWDRLAAAGVSGSYYFSDVPFTALWGDKYLRHLRSPSPQFLADCAAGTLPAVSLRRPALPRRGHRDLAATTTRTPTSAPASPSSTRSTTRSPPARLGQDGAGHQLRRVGRLLRPRRRRPRRPTPTRARALRGFRVPCLVDLAARPRGYVAHDVYDHTSILKMIEWRWGLPPLTPAGRGGPQPRRGARLRERPRPHRARVRVPPVRRRGPCRRRRARPTRGMERADDSRLADGWSL